MKHRQFMIISPLLRENFKVSLNAVKANRLRSSLTIAIIAIGITALVGIMTAMDALKGSVNDSFRKFGAGSFTISAGYSATTSAVHKRVRNKRQVTWAQARRFMDTYDVPAVKTLYAKVASYDVFKTERTKSDPRMTLIAADENYLDYMDLPIDKGLPLSKSDVDASSFKTVLGHTTAEVLFGRENPIGRTVIIRGSGYQVCGVAALQGDSMDAFDLAALIPVSTARATILSEESSWKIGVKPEGDISGAKNRAEVLMRAIRRLEPSDGTDFSIEGSNSLMDEVNELLGSVSAVAFVIGLITLLGAAVGLTNIMLVSVRERTREIGVRKALGASSSTIRRQFFMEAVIIGQAGGLTGIFIGVGAANLLLAALDAPVTIPWFWMLSAVLLCFIVSILSCSIPARRAAELDPIEALRYE